MWLAVGADTFLLVIAAADPFGYNLLTVLGAEERTPTL
jgi:hypothetical protein